MVRETLQIGDPRLKETNREITDFDDPKVRQVVEDLVETMRAAELVGLAAPQIGENWRIFVTEPRETKTRTGDQTDVLRVFINPSVVNSSEEEVIIYEGCGCVAKGTLFGPVSRPKEVTIVAQDQTGRRFSLRCDGILGRVVQHENDHMSGIEFTEKITDYMKIMGIDHYIARIRNSPEQKQASVITVKEHREI
jgi:peptide deformylase